MLRQLLGAAGWGRADGLGGGGEHGKRRLCKHAFGCSSMSKSLGWILHGKSYEREVSLKD